jgi:hypothetical protein
MEYMSLRRGLELYTWYEGNESDRDDRANDRVRSPSRIRS